MEEPRQSNGNREADYQIQRQDDNKLYNELRYLKAGIDYFNNRFDSEPEQYGITAACLPHMGTCTAYIRLTISEAYSIADTLHMRKGISPAQGLSLSGVETFYGTVEYDGLYFFLILEMGNDVLLAYMMYGLTATVIGSTIIALLWARLMSSSRSRRAERDIAEGQNHDDADKQR